MMRFLKQVGVASVGELGRCLFCVRAAFLSALVAWAATLALLVFAREGFASILAAMTAVAFTTLWAAHLTAHALRVVEVRRMRTAVPAAARHSNPTRRETLRVFVAAFAAIATASVFIASTRRAIAADEGCPDEAPNGCGTAYCCAGPAKWHCQGYTGYANPWRTLVNFCTNADSDEDIADLRSNCAVLTSC